MKTSSRNSQHTWVKWLHFLSHNSTVYSQFNFQCNEQPPEKMQASSVTHRAGPPPQHAGSTTSSFKTVTTRFTSLFTSHHPAGWGSTDSYCVQFMAQLCTCMCYSSVELMLSQVWQSEEIANKQAKNRPDLNHPALHSFPSKGQVSERKKVFKIIILNFKKIGPPSKAHGQEQKWGYRTERGFGPGRSEEWHQLSHHQQDWTPSQLSMGLLYHQHAARSSGAWTILKSRATAGYPRPLSQRNWEADHP